MNHATDHHLADHADALQARLAMRLTAALGEQAQALPHDIGERLRIGRERALARAVAVRAESAPAVVGVGSGGAAVLGGGPSWWMRLASFAPLLVLAAGLVMIQHWNTRAQIDTAAEIDAALLSDHLPPAAYSDPGFGEFLKQPQP